MDVGIDVVPSTGIGDNGGCADSNDSDAFDYNNTQCSQNT